jgi:hypothetical protein
MMELVLIALCSLMPAVLGGDGEPVYPWLPSFNASESLAARIPPPEGYERVACGADTFADWLRRLPLKPGRPPVYLYNGRAKYNQQAHHAVVAMDVGNRNLQQCADAVIRLRAEYLYSQGRYADIRFNFTGGGPAVYTEWAKGYRPTVEGSRVEWWPGADEDFSYQNFRSYLDIVFAYAGTWSLSRELRPVAKPQEVNIGDVFIRGGFPGHAVIVVDVASDPATGKKVFLLAQSYMPAQEVHILRNLNDAALSPWFEADFGERLVTPEWTFSKNELRSFEVGQTAVK